MAKCRSYYQIFLILVLTSGASLWMVKGDQGCREKLGPCDSSCNSTCMSKHPGGKGSCEVAGGVASCMCDFGCMISPPINNRRCNESYGVCSRQCGDACCDQRCGFKFPDLHANGFCFSLIPPVDYCMCDYDC